MDALDSMEGTKLQELFTKMGLPARQTDYPSVERLRFYRYLVLSGRIHDGQPITFLRRPQSL